MTEDKEKCIGCEKEFPEDKISHSSGEPMCDTCENEFHQEIKRCGVEKLDEYLAARGLQEDFNIFCQAKFSSCTEEEVCDTNENIDHEYERWNLQALKGK